MDPTYDSVRELLKQVNDPELMMNIIDLGLVYDIEIQPKAINIDMTLTSPGCPAGPQLIGETNHVITSAYPDREVNVNLVWVPFWTPDLMSQEAKDELGFF